jgi:peptide/nickel transport system substrate-binding protein
LPPLIKRPFEIVEATIEGGSPETVDPAWSYDTASGELISNVYETLLTHDGEHVDKFIPQLATGWTVENITGTTSPEELPWYFRYTFAMRTGVQFQDGSTLTPKDVEYSFERSMIQARLGGTQWMFYEPLLNVSGADDLGNIGIPEEAARYLFKASMKEFVTFSTSGKAGADCQT